MRIPLCVINCLKNNFNIANIILDFFGRMFKHSKLLEKDKTLGDRLIGASQFETVILLYISLSLINIIVLFFVLYV